MTENETEADGTEQREIADLLLEASEKIDEAADRVEESDRDCGLTRGRLADIWREKGEYCEEAAGLMQMFADDIENKDASDLSSNQT